MTTSLDDVGDTGRPWFPVRSGRLDRLMPLLLMFMAFADAYGFWTVLYAILLSDKFFLLVVVVALAFGSVLGAHEIGRLARRRREGYDASLAWIGFLTAVWVGVGSGVAWTRAHQSQQSGGVPAGTGTIVIAAPTTNSGSNLTMALILAALYLLTGALAAGYAYRHGNPRAAAAREALARHEQLLRRQVRLRADGDRAARLMKQRGDERERDTQARDDKHDEARAYAPELNRLTDTYMAEVIEGGPSATEAVTRPRP